MKNSVKKMGAMLVALVMVCALFAGCGANTAQPDASTPDGSMMLQLNTLKTGKISDLSLYDAQAIDEQLEGSGMTLSQIENLVKGIFGKTNYQIESVEEISDTRANVTISGQAVDMAKYIPLVGTEFIAQVTEFSTQNDTADMSQEEATKEIMGILLSAIEAKQSSVTLKDVTATIAMEKKDGKWDVVQDEENVNEMLTLLMGGSMEEIQESVQNTFGNMFGGLAA